MKILDDLKKYIPYNEQEAFDLPVIIDFIQNQVTPFNRDNKLGHITASAWVTNKTRDKILMVYHNIYNSWSWLGGHADDETNLLDKAIEEVKEESGIVNISPISKDIFSVEVLTVDGHIKNGGYLNSHLHLNVTYLLEADDSQELKISPTENSDVKWVNIEEAVGLSNEKWFRDNVYSKLNEKLIKYYKI